MLFKTARVPTSCLSLLILLTSTAHPAANTITHVRSYIQATAHVESPFGMTEATFADQSVGLFPDPGDHLFWLFHPCADGVKILIEGDIPPDHLECHSRYEFASLVRLTSGNRTGDVTITVVFTDN